MHILFIIVKLVVFILSVFLRLLNAMSNYKPKEGEVFTIKGYFDLRHIIRWLKHLVASTLIFIGLPELFKLIEPYAPWITGLVLIPIFVAGYYGYDGIKWLEKKFSKKIEEEIKPEEENAQ